MAHQAAEEVLSDRAGSALRNMQQNFLETLQRSNVGIQTDHPVGAAAGVAHRGATRKYPATAAVLVDRPVLALEARRCAVQVCREPVFELRDVVGVEMCLPGGVGVVRVGIGN